MTATTAADDPLPPFYIGAHLAPILEDAEVSFFQAPLPRFQEIPPPQWHGTQPAVAKLVGKFPFRTPDKCRHEPHQSATAPTPQAPLTDSTNVPTKDLPDATPARTPVDLAALRQQICKNMENLDRLFPLESMQPTMTTLQQPPTLQKQPAFPLTPPTPSNTSPESKQVDVCNLNDLDRYVPLTPTSTIPPDPSHQPASLPTPQTHSNLSPTAAAKCEPVDLKALQRQLLQMQQKAEWLFPSLVTTIQQRFPPPTVAIPNAPPPDPSHQPHQPASLPTPQTHSNLSPTAAATSEPVDLKALQRQLLKMQQKAEWLYPSLVTTIQQRFPPPTVTIPNAPPPNNTLPAHAPSNPTPAPPATFVTTHLMQPTLSMTEWLALNTTRGNNSPWIPQALHRRHTLHPTKEQSQLPTQPSDCKPGIFPLLANAMPSANNTPAANHDIVSGNPAPTTHFWWLATCQHHHHQHSIHLPWATNRMALDHSMQHHSLLAANATRPYNPAFDIHPMMVNHHQTSHQLHTQLPVATNVPGFAQNKWPP